MDRAQHWQRRRRALCSSLGSKNTLYFSVQLSGDKMQAESTSSRVVCNYTTLFWSSRRALQRRSEGGYINFSKDFG